MAARLATLRGAARARLQAALYYMRERLRELRKAAAEEDPEE